MLESGPQRVNGTRGQDMCLDSYEVRRRRSSLEAVSSVCAVNILVSDMAIYYFEVQSAPTGLSATATAWRIIACPKRKTSASHWRNKLGKMGNISCKR
jgi:hypothetical protein